MDLTGVAEMLAPRTRAELPPWRPGTKLLAGGTWLYSEPQPGVDRLIDLAGFGWPPMVLDADGLHIAATCTIAELSRFTPPPELSGYDLIQPCCEALLGSFKVWNAATVGGNICLALPAGPMTALATALHSVATIWTNDGGTRTMDVAQLVTGDHQTSLADGEILRAITLPISALRRRVAIRRISLTPLGRSAALLIGTRDRDGRFALTLTAAVPHPIRIETPELPTPAELNALVEARVAGDWFHDIHGTPDWRRHVSLMFADEIRQELA